MTHTSTNPAAPVSGKSFLKDTVLPALRTRLPKGEGNDGTVILGESRDGTPAVHACYRDSLLINIEFRRIDQKRARLVFSLFIGVFYDDPLGALLQIGPVLQKGAFRMNFDTPLYGSHFLSASSELVVRGTDTELVMERIDEVVALAFDLHWFTALYLPTCLGIGESSRIDAAIDVHPTDSDALAAVLDAALASPVPSEPPEVLAHIARGLSRWDDLLAVTARLDDDKAWTYGPLRARAFLELDRPQDALRTARAAGLVDGRFPGAPWLSPGYVCALIASGDDIEALRLLGRPADGEPGFYDLLRGRALAAAGDHAGALVSFARYTVRFPGDLAAQAEAYPLLDPDG